MLKTPKEMLNAAEAALKAKAQREEQQKLKADELSSLLKKFEALCLSAALERRTHIYFDSRIKQVSNLADFKVEEVKKDEARERFLANIKLELEAEISTKLERLSHLGPKFSTSVFPNYLANDLRSLLANCARLGSAEEALARLKIQLAKASSLGEIDLSAFAEKCEGAILDFLKLGEVEVRLAKVSDINSKIPSGLISAVKIGWDAAPVKFGKAGILTAKKLKWIATIWPRWEKHFNKDIESTARSGSTSREYQFWSAGYWGDDNSFVVSVKNLPEVESIR